jgi:hypothetical protein
MQSLSAELKQVIIRRVEKAHSSEILEIASQLCSNEEAPVFEFSSSSAPQRFTAANGMVSDSLTGLIWSANDIGERHDWPGAHKAVAKLDLGGFTDWRLPTIKELLTLVDYDRSSPAIDPIFSTCKADWYWTLTALKSSPGDYAWYVDFGDGFSDCLRQDDEGLVRAVRSRQ